MVAVAVGGITIGLAVMILAVGVVRGFRYTVRDKIIGFGAHVQITNYTVGEDLESPPMPENVDFIPLLLQNDYIKNIQRFALKPGIIKTDEEIQGVIFKGVDSDFDWSFFSQNLVEGALPVYTGDTLNASAEILVSKEISRRLGVSLSDTITAFFINRSGERLPNITTAQRAPRRYAVVGIYETGLSEFDEKFMLCDINQIRDLNNWYFNKVSGYEILITDFDKLAEVAEYTDDIVGYEYQVKTVRQLNRAVFDWLDQQDVHVAIIITLMLIVGVMGMISALLILILERVRMIGILKTLGMSNVSIRNIFMYRAAYILLTGIMLGNFIGIGLGIFQQQTGMVKLDKESYYMDTVPVYFDMYGLLGINLLTFLFCIITLVLPTFLVTKITPLQAIRTD